MQNLLIRGSRGGDVRKLKQALVKQLGADAAAFGGLATGDELDADTEAALRCWQAGVGLVAAALEASGLTDRPYGAGRTWHHTR